MININTENKKSIIHVGMHKSASTSLQRSFFPKYCIENDFFYLNDDKNFVNALKIFFISQNPENLYVLHNYIKNIKKPYLFSYEGLISENPLYWKESLLLTNDIFRDVEVILVVRKPSDYIKSLFLQKVKEGQVTCLSTFFGRNMCTKGVGWEFEPFSLSHFSIDSLIKITNEIFKSTQIISFDSVIKNHEYIRITGNKKFNSSISYFVFNLIILCKEYLPSFYNIFNENQRKFYQAEKKLVIKKNIISISNLDKLVKYIVNCKNYDIDLNLTDDEKIIIEREDENFKKLFE